MSEGGKKEFVALVDAQPLNVDYEGLPDCEFIEILNAPVVAESREDAKGAVDGVDERVRLYDLLNLALQKEPFASISREITGEKKGEQNKILTLLEDNPKIEDFLNAIFKLNYAECENQDAYLVILTVYLELFSKSQLPDPNEIIETHLINRILEIVDLQELTGGKLLAKIEETGSIQALCSEEMAIDLNERVAERAKKLDMAEEDLIACMNSILESSVNHADLNREVYSRVPLVMLLANWNKAKDFVENKIGAVRVQNIMDLGDIDYRDIPEELSDEFHQVIKDVYRSLLQVASYMTAFLNTEKSNREETMKVFSLLEELVAYPQFTEIQRIEARNNTISILLHHQETAKSPESAQSLLELFEENGRKIIKNTDVCVPVDCPLQGLVFAISNDVLPVIMEGEDSSENREMVLIVTAYLNMFAAATKDAKILKYGDFDVDDLQVELDGLLQIETDFYSNLLDELASNSARKGIQYKNTFLSLVRELVLFTMGDEDLSEKLQVQRFFPIIFQGNSLVPPSEGMFKRLIELREKETEKFQKVSSYINIIENILFRGAPYNGKTLSELLEDKSTFEGEMNRIETVVETVYSIILELMADFDLGLAEHSKALGEFLDNAMTDYAAVMDHTKQTSLGETGEEYLTMLAKFMKTDVPVLWERFKKYLINPISSKDVTESRKAGIKHDIGKFRTPPEVLFKQGPLNDGEFEVMQGHVWHGADICKGLYDEKTLEIILHHHEKWNGGGYCCNLEGGQIDLATRIAFFGDVLDATTRPRGYNDKKFKGLNNLEILMRGIEILVRNRKNICPFIFETQFANLGLNADEVTAIVKGKELPQIIKEGELEKMIDPNSKRVQGQINRIENAFSNLQNKRQILEQLGEIVENIGLNNPALVALGNLGITSDKVKTMEEFGLTGDKVYYLKRRFGNIANMLLTLEKVMIEQSEIELADGHNFVGEQN